MRKFLLWLDDNILSVLAGFLLIFIPLYPKLPLRDILPGYIVRVRLEDILVSFCVGLWIIWFIRGKLKLLENPLFKPIMAYLVVGLLSVLSAIFLIHTVPMEKIHVMKILLHYLRRIEYFSLFFIFYSSVRNLRILKIYICIFILTVILASIYGFGQRYLYWPAFSTMNREFSKGWMLYLTEHARVLSTFGGHYDLAAYIMMSLVLLWSIFFSIKKIISKIFIFIVIAMAFWTLILTASRTSFIAYLSGITLMFFFWAFRKGITWSFKRWFGITALSIIVMLSFGDLSERFTKLLKIDQRVSGIKSLLFSPIVSPPTDKALFLENNPQYALSQITSKSDQPPSPLRPSDVFQDMPLLVPQGTGSAISVPRTYSRTAYRYDLSTAIRLDALWPQAIKGFKRNVLLGSGYSTLNKLQPTEFTEAESTDNDFLRSVGETGILGFLTFFGTLVLVLYIIWRHLAIIRDPVVFGIASALAGIIFGLLVNAVYIDVFESSKVAFTFWALTGFVLGGLKLIQKEKENIIPQPVIPDLARTIISLKDKIRIFIKGDKFYLLVILVLAFTVRLYKIDAPLADWHSWRQADTSAVTRNYVKHGINILYPTYDDLSNVASGHDNPKGLRFVEFPLYNIFSVVTDKVFVGFNVEFSGRLTSIFAALGSIIFIFLMVRKYIGRPEAIASAGFYAFLPFNIFFTRVILPEPLLVFTSLGMVYFFDKLIETISQIKISQSSEDNNSRLLRILFLLILSLVFTISSVLVKPFSVFLFLPMAYILIKGLGFSIKSIFVFFIYLFICMLPFILWRFWINQFPEGTPANLWLFNGDGIRFKGAFFYWIFADRLSRLILGYWGLPFLILGILAPVKKEKSLFRFWGISILLFITVFATGNVRHDYYQTFTIPIIAIFMGKGLVFFWDIGKKLSNRLTFYILTIIMLVFTGMFGWYHIRDFYNINHPEIVEAGRAVERLTSDKALVIAPYNGDTAFLYQTRRAGWPVMQESVDKMIQMGAQYFVSVNFDDLTNQLIKEATIPDESIRKYKIINQTDKYVTIQLVPDNKLLK